jgi:glycosyltransferase involved in cell wall biosynthesis
MRVLFLSPQPFYQERGTPIAVKIALEALSKKLHTPDSTHPTIDLLCYAEGSDVSIPGVRIHRIPTPPFLKGVRPGISVKKLLLDVIFLFSTLALVLRNRKEPYAIVHAVEESVFIAWFIKQIWAIPYIYDMDSSLSMQVTEKWGWCKPLYPLLYALERLAVRGSIAVAPVCDALHVIATDHGSPHTVILRDVSLLPASTSTKLTREEAFGSHIGVEQPVILYVGNLESYQGIDLLLESFNLLRNHETRPHLVIIGGTAASIAHYQSKAVRLGCENHVSFLGPRPVTDLKEYLELADILVSPRIKGNNTPMKIYSYLHSGRALIATDLPTHRQVLDDEISILAPCSPEGFSQGLKKLLQERAVREQLGTSAKARAEKLYTLEAFEGQLFALYNEVRARIANGTSQSHLIAQDKI